VTFPFVSVVDGRTERAVWTGQNGNGIPNDCGPANVKGFLTWLDKAKSFTVADIARVIDGPEHNGTTAKDCTDYLKRFSLTPVLGSNCTAAPFVPLVQYNRLPVANRLDKSGRTFLHWITVTEIRPNGDVVYNDPYHASAADGAGLVMTAAQFRSAEVAVRHRWSVLERPAPVVEDGSGSGADEVAEQVYIQPETNIRASRSTASSANILGESAKTWLPVQAVRESATVEGFTWWRVALQPVWPAGLFAAEKQRPDVKVAYVRADRVRKTVPVTPPPVVTPPSSDPIAARVDAAPARYLLGIHELCCNGVSDAHSAGARALMVFNNATGAYQQAAADPGSIVMSRIYFNQPISPAELLRQHGINPSQRSDSRAWYRGVNEFDVPGYGGNVDDIKRRADFDAEAATILKTAAPNARWVGGGLPHGNYNFNKAEICDAVERHYAPHYNSRLLGAFDMHNYPKTEVAAPKDYRVYAPIWLARRADFLFTHCGFDPRIRRIVSSEYGIEGPNGGIAHLGFTHEEFAGFCDWTLDVMTAPLVMPDGKVYPSPYIAQTFFQLYGKQQGRWQGYEMAGYMPVLRDFYARGKRRNLRNLVPLFELTAGGKPEFVDYVPPMKAME
jgi:hypothetical protein